ncbi:3-oxoacyl-ACP reductase FabG [Pseudoclavibacter sp. 8L]|uniref:3-oxoacyl-ACP reductase FabG n=1 Tax=Pseudoclavibacter sp. 8L TaxID=2653162 RepID=UPI0012F09A4F|nr:3-oxoacyl-ACP reductase FabG [Pseudoclavibacter sp. 8L]VXB07187.1 3-oxoacyl-ACP reductase FabG [Pseudoclavibacter sp. 8L]
MPVAPLFDLSDTRVVVTGGTKGIGFGIASVFAQAGARVAVAGRSQTGVDTAVAALSLVADADTRARISGFTVDVTDPESCRALAASTAAVFGGIDVLCANAGIFPQADLATMTPAQLDEVLDTNVKGTIYAVQACLPALRESGRGRVVLTSSITGPTTGYPGWSHYGASKAAQLGFMRTAAIELAKHAITVNAVLPGNVESAGLDEMGEDYLASMTSAVPLRRLGRAEEIGYAAAFLASREAGYITGQTIVVDGGQTLPESPDALG